MSIAESIPFHDEQPLRSDEASAGAAAVFTANVVVPFGQVASHAEASPPTASRVAEAIAEAPSIGYACAALRGAGWRATIAGNRISVNEEVFAQYVGVSAGSRCNAMWMIYGSADASPIWVTTGDPA